MSIIEAFFFVLVAPIFYILFSILIKFIIKCIIWDQYNRFKQLIDLLIPTPPEEIFVLHFLLLLRVMLAFVMFELIEAMYNRACNDCLYYTKKNEDGRSTLKNTLLENTLSYIIIASSFGSSIDLIYSIIIEYIHWILDIWAPYSEIQRKFEEKYPRLTSEDMHNNFTIIAILSVGLALLILFILVYIILYKLQVKIDSFCEKENGCWWRNHGVTIYP